MSIALLLGSLLCLVAIAATVRALISDGYRRVPTRRQGERDDWH